MDEDVTTVSPTLGFIIKTIDFQEWVSNPDSLRAWLNWHRYKLNICESHWFPVCSFGLTAAGDVGGQKTLRSYWKNYFEKTDTLVWVVDATDRLRVDDCREELAGLLLEEVRILPPPCWPPSWPISSDWQGPVYWSSWINQTWNIVWAKKKFER